VQHIQKNIWQLGNFAADIVMPPGEVWVLDDLDHSDANAVKQRSRISCPNIEQSSDHTTNICADFYNAIHIANLPKTFDGWLQHLPMGLNIIKLAFIFCHLLGLTACNDPYKITLFNKTYNGDGLCLMFNESRLVSWKLQLRRTEAKFLEM
jgi:hypothetical protein